MSRQATSMLFAFALALVASTAASAPTSPERYRDLALEIFRELIEIDTTDSVGDNGAAARAVARHLLAAGFDEEDVVVLGPIPRKHNLVARLRGRSTGKRPLLLLAHLDVVEADPADWSVHPFEFLERDGYYYGRGTTDDKEQAAIWAANLIRLKHEGTLPDRDIIIALTADEEGGDHNGIIWLLDNRPELIDAELALNEGGGGALRNNQAISNTVQLSEKVYLSFQLEITDPGGHSSLPRSDNPIYRLSEALSRIGEYQFPVRLNEVTRAFFERSAELATPEIRAAMEGILREPPDYASEQTLSAIPSFNARLRTTCVATQMQAGHAENALPQRARAVVNCRILPGVPPETVASVIGRLVDDTRISITSMQTPTPSSPSPLDPGILLPIEQTTEEMWPGIPVIPTMSTGATDGLYLRNAGIPVYGVSGIFGDIDDVRAHGRDERISAKSFYEGQEFLYRLVRRLAF